MLVEAVLQAMIKKEELPEDDSVSNPDSKDGNGGDDDEDEDLWAAVDEKKKRKEKWDKKRGELEEKVLNAMPYNPDAIMQCVIDFNNNDIERKSALAEKNK